MKKHPLVRCSASTRALFSTLALVALSPLLVSGVTLTWDSDASSANGATDGQGTWNTTNTNWYPGGTNPQTDVVWSNTTADIAVFGNGGVGNTVTVGTVNAGGITFAAVTTTAYTLNSGTITLGSGAIIDNNSTINPRINSVLSGANIVFQADSGNTASSPTTNLFGVNSLTGTTVFGGGSNKLLAYVGNTGSLGTAAVSVLSGNTLRIAALGTYSNNFTIAGNGVGSRGAINFGGTAVNFATPVTLTGQITLAGNAMVSNTSAQGLGVISGNIVESVTSSRLTILSQAVPINLSGTNTYTGGTTINTGGSGLSGERVLFNNTAGSATGTGAITMNSTSATLYATIGGGNDAASGGTATTRGTGANVATSGTYAANVRGMLTGTVSTGSFSHIAPGSGTQTATAGTFTASVGTLTVGGLTLGTSNVLDYDFNTTNKTNDFVAVVGALTLGTGTTINLFQEGSTSSYLATTGTYNLFSYGTLVGDVSNLSVAAASQQSGFTYSFVNDTADSLIQLQITAVPEPSTWAVGMLTMIAASGALWRRRKPLF